MVVRLVCWLRKIQEEKEKERRVGCVVSLCVESRH